MREEATATNELQPNLDSNIVYYAVSPKHFDTVALYRWLASKQITSKLAQTLANIPHDQFYFYGSDDAGRNIFVLRPGAFTEHFGTKTAQLKDLAFFTKLRAVLRAAVKHTRSAFNHLCSLFHDPHFEEPKNLTEDVAPEAAPPTKASATTPEAKPGGSWGSFFCGVLCCGCCDDVDDDSHTAGLPRL